MSKEAYVEFLEYLEEKKQDLKNLGYDNERIFDGLF